MKVLERSGYVRPYQLLEQNSTKEDYELSELGFVFNKHTHIVQPLLYRMVIEIREDDIDDYISKLSYTPIS